MSNENAENIQNGTVTPAPSVATAPAKAEANVAVSAPAESPAEVQNKKITAAFIAQRQQIRDLKRQATAAPVAPAPSPAPAPAPAPAEQVPAVVPIVSTVPATDNAEDIAVLEKQAIQSLSEDKDIASIPGATIDILSMIDADPRLARIYNKVDPTLAIKEAKSMYMAKAGISPAPAVPMSATPSGGMSGGSVNLESLIAECEKHRPGTKEFNSLAKKIQAEMSKLHQM